MSEKIVEISEDSLLWIDERYNRLREENKRLHNIIKEVREYIESFKKIYEGHYPYIDTRHLDLNKILEILDKENNSEQKRKEPIIS